MLDVTSLQIFDNTIDKSKYSFRSKQSPLCNLLAVHCHFVLQCLNRCTTSTAASDFNSRQSMARDELPIFGRKTCSLFQNTFFSPLKQAQQTLIYYLNMNTRRLKTVMCQLSNEPQHTFRIVKNVISQISLVL